MTRNTSERGAVLVQVAIAILVLTAMATFVVDHGILWVSRGQAQNAADAGALSGAIARAYDELTSPPASNGKAFNSAMGAALANNVWTIPPTANVTFPSCALSPACPCPPGVACVRVDVYRNGEFGSTPLPTIFGKVLNISSQGVRATATARVALANSTNCMRPFAVIDRWNDIVDPTLIPPEFQRWDTQGGDAGTELNPKDIFTPPSAVSAGTGYTLPQHFGTQVIVKTGNNPNSVAGSIGPGWSLPLRLPDGNGGYVSGASDFQDAIKHCIGNPVTIGDYLPTENGVMTGPTTQGVETDQDSLIKQDPYAVWDGSKIAGSCAPGCGGFSPRIVPIAVFDMDEFQWRTSANNWDTSWIPGVGPGTSSFSCPIGGRCVRVTNILGFFVEAMGSGDVTGRLVSYPGEFVMGAPSVGGGAAFLMNIQLVR